eukprot:248428-Hanusia_phi.AAC.2
MRIAIHQRFFASHRGSSPATTRVSRAVRLVRVVTGRHEAAAMEGAVKGEGNSISLPAAVTAGTLRPLPAHQAHRHRSRAFD